LVISVRFSMRLLHPSDEKPFP